MISVLVLDGFSKSDFGICNIYIPLFTGILRYNGVLCETVNTGGLEEKYSIQGKTGDSLIYVPVLSVAESLPCVSFLYTDSTAASSVSFRIASDLRREREQNGEVIFVNALHESDPLKRFSPVIADHVKLTSEKSGIYRTAAAAAKCICTYYGKEFFDPAEN